MNQNQSKPIKTNQKRRKTQQNESKRIKTIQKQSKQIKIDLVIISFVFCIHQEIHNLLSENPSQKLKKSTQPKHGIAQISSAAIDKRWPLF